MENTLQSECVEHEGMSYGLWRAERMFTLAPVQAYVGKYLQSFEKFPPRQKPGFFNLGDAMDRISKGTPPN